jgi:glutaredoxin
MKFGDRFVAAGTEGVILYVVPACPLCDDARTALRAEGVTFVERDVANDFGALRRMYKNTRQSLVPVVEKDGAFLVRPSRDEIRRIL